MTFDILGILNLFSPFVLAASTPEPEPTPPEGGNSDATLGMDIY